jgi:Protein of unknown function (DUF2442)
VCPQSLSEKDSPSSITPPIQPRMPWRVIEVHPLSNFRLRVRFVDGLEGTVDMSALIHSPTAGVFAPLADPARFAQAFVAHGAVTWPGEIDLAPDAMYAEVKKLGHWVLG